MLFIQFLYSLQITTIVLEDDNVLGCKIRLLQATEGAHQQLDMRYNTAAFTDTAVGKLLLQENDRARGLV